MRLTDTREGVAYTHALHDPCFEICVEAAGLLLWLAIAKLRHQYEIEVSLLVVATHPAADKLWVDPA